MSAKNKRNEDSLLKAFYCTDCKKLLLTGLVVFIVMFILDAVIHGNLLMPLYTKSAKLMLAPAVAQTRMHFMWLGQLIYAMLLVLLYSQGIEGKGSVNQGIRFGIYIGLLMAIPGNMIMYGWSKFPANMLLGWGVSEFIKLVIFGAIIGALYKSK